MDSAQIVLNMLPKPFKQFFYLLIRIVGQGSTEHLPNMLFAFFIIQLNQAVLFKYSVIISNEIPYQLGDFESLKKIFLPSHLIYYLFYVNIFKYLLVAQNVNIDEHPSQLW